MKYTFAFLSGIGSFIEAIFFLIGWAIVILIGLGLIGFVLGFII
jgi:hypothetical protein|tara:strand:- start:143 stop:274 length:132 start_codon:yes stop_codon:yes gene_type:complete